MTRFHVIKDTREKEGHGWWYDEDPYCSGTTKAKIHVGDYTIEDLEHLLCIERKESVSEFAGNCGEKRFLREMDKMETFKYKFLIFEFDWYHIEKYPEASKVPKSKWSSIRIKGKYMMSVITSLMVDKGITVLACGDSKRASDMAFKIMRKVYNAELRR